MIWLVLVHLLFILTQTKPFKNQLGLKADNIVVMLSSQRYLKFLNSRRHRRRRRNGSRRSVRKLCSCVWCDVRERRGNSRGHCMLLPHFFNVMSLTLKRRRGVWMRCHENFRQSATAGRRPYARHRKDFFWFSWHFKERITIKYLHGNAYSRKIT